MRDLFSFIYIHTYNMRFYQDGLSFPSFMRFVKVARSYTNKDSHLSELIKHFIVHFDDKLLFIFLFIYYIIYFFFRDTLSYNIEIV